MVEFLIIMLIMMFLGVFSFCIGMSFIISSESSNEDGMTFVFIGLILIFIAIWLTDIVYPITMGGCSCLNM